ncbi:hypothetical protein AZH53_05910 [Methanomicrobiaceae archaeon CYW5]|uniref:hypothetical protein n=1 Tax=Methanovulcanius yangii TaxID=1789227 RepID=UPI0029CA7E7A|nr:hypothetical protein [Methanovulcanius yangii]MBT8507944.1 hypothetical protein [Methanovulcanius yangii]
MEDEPAGQEMEKEDFILFEKEITRIQDAIDAFPKGEFSHIALIGEPFAGQNTIMGEIREKNPGTVTYIPFFNVVKGKEAITSTYGTKDIVLMDRCHFLALRRIGGFAMLDAFLDMISMSDKKMFITSWNSFTWSYLRAVKDIDKFFPVVIEVPKMDSKALMSAVLSHYEGDIQFIDDVEPPGEQPVVTTKRVRLPLPFGYSRDIPWPRLNIGGGTSAKTTEEEPDAKKVAFDKITRIAEGNYGVALRIWERSLDYPELKLSRIPDPPCAVDLDINESFLLNIVLSMESISFTDLAEIASPEIDIEQTLYRLTRQGLIEEDKGYYRVNPETLNCVISHLRRIRMVW